MITWVVVRWFLFQPSYVHGGRSDVPMPPDRKVRDPSVAGHRVTPPHPTGLAAFTATPITVRVVPYHTADIARHHTAPRFDLYKG